MFRSNSRTLAICCFVLGLTLLPGMSYAQSDHESQEPLGASQNPLSDYVTEIPFTPGEALNPYEEKVLTAYLDNPDSVHLAKLLAKYHSFLSLKYFREGDAHQQNSVRALQHTIYAQYFYHRAIRSGANSYYSKKKIRRLERRLAQLLPTDRPLDFASYTPAQKTFIDAFTLDESQRHVANEQILIELLNNPTNMRTNFYSAAVNLWNGSESPYDDPRMLYFYLVNNYLAERTEQLSIRAEQEWLQDPENNPLFQLGIEIGGFTVPGRRWLATLHNDNEAQQLLNAEMDIWLDKFPHFYWLPASIFHFSNPDTVWTGFSNFYRAIEACTTDPLPLCANTAKSPYVTLAFQLLSADVFMIIGDKETASSTLLSRYVPEFNFDSWVLGQDAWLHREQNLDEIFELYQNDDPSDDPVSAYIYPQKWSVSNGCQMCHQGGLQNIPAEDRYKPLPPLSDERLFFGEWPAYTVSWYGEPIQN